MNKSKQIVQIISAITSETTVEIQIPFTPQISGSKSTVPICKISVLHTDTMAEISPLLSAVKNEDVNMFKLENMNAKA